MQGKVFLEGTDVVGDGGQDEVMLKFLQISLAAVGKGQSAGDTGIQAGVDCQSFEGTLVGFPGTGLVAGTGFVFALPVIILAAAGREDAQQGVVVDDFEFPVAGGIVIVVGIFAPYAVHPLVGFVVVGQQGAVYPAPLNLLQLIEGLREVAGGGQDGGTADGAAVKVGWLAGAEGGIVGASDIV